MKLKLPVYKLLGQIADNREALQYHIDRLVQLQEERHVAYTHFTEYQAQIKRVFNRKVKGKNFQIGDIVLLCYKRNEKYGDHGKCDSLWLGSYRIDMRGCQSMGSG